MLGRDTVQRVFCAIYWLKGHHFYASARKKDLKKDESKPDEKADPVVVENADAKKQRFSYEYVFGETKLKRSLM